MAKRVSREPWIYQALSELALRLFDGDAPPAADDIERVLRQVIDALGTSPHPGAREGEVTACAAAFIRQHCLSSLSLEQVARAVGCSRFTLIRGFRRDYGITPHAFLIDCRIRQGQHALGRGESIAEAALNCRFADQAHFQRTFKRVTAATPQQYRRVTSDPGPVHWPPAAPPSTD